MILTLLACELQRTTTQTILGGRAMETLIAAGGSDRGDAEVDGGEVASNAIVVSEWDADAFHRRVLFLELQGYVVRRETYRVMPEMNPDTGQIIHLHTVELCLGGSDQAESGRSSGSSEQAGDV